MQIDDFIWLPDIVDKLAVKHNVTQDEAEDVFFNRPRYRFVEAGYRPGEDVYSAGGQTDAENTALILSARDMDRREPPAERHRVRGKADGGLCQKQPSGARRA